MAAALGGPDFTMRKGVSGLARTRPLILATMSSIARRSGIPQRGAPQHCPLLFRRNLRFGWKIARWDENGFSGFIPLVMTPVGLEEDRVDLGEIDGFGAVSDGFSGGFPLTWCRTQVADAGSAQLVERLVYTE